MAGLEGTLVVQLDLKKDDFMCFWAWLWDIREILRAVGGDLLPEIYHMSTQIFAEKYF